MKKVLDVPTPLVNYTPPNDAILSILQSNIDLHWGTICENFVGMVGEDTFWVEFRWFQLWSNYRTMDIVHIPRILFDKQTILEHLTQAINSGYHILLNVDTYYIEKYDNYQRSHGWHDLFIYGFDEDAQVFYCRDYFDYQRYSQAVIPFCQLADAYIFYGHQNDYLNGILLLQQKRSDQIPLLPFYWERLYDGLHSLVAPQALDATPKQWCGFQYFDHVKAALLKDPKSLRIRAIHFLVAHIRIMQYRLELLAARFPFIPKALLDEIAILLQRSQQIERLFIKCQLLDPVSPQLSRLTNSMHLTLQEIEERYNPLVWQLMHIIESP